MERPARRLVGWLTMISFLSSPSYAGTRPSLAVPPLGDSADQRASAAIAKAFEETGKVTVIDRSAVDKQIQARKKTSADAGEAGQAASEALKKGQEALKKLKPKEAVTYLTQAKLAYRKQLADDESFQGLRAAQFHLAMAYLTLKDETRATEEMREFVRLDPERSTRQISEKTYSPSVRNLHQKVREEMAGKPHGDLLVSTIPPKVVVHVDGKPEGASPLAVRSLPAGEHFVRLSGEGLEGHFAPKFIVPGENRLEVELKPAVVVDPYQTFGTVASPAEIDHRRAAFLDELGLALGTDIWVFLSPGNAEVSGQLYDQRSQEVSPVAKDSTPEGLVAKLVRFIDAGGYVIRPAESEKPAVAAAPPPRNLPANLEPSAEGTFSKEAGKPLEPEIRAPRKRAVWYRNPWVWAGIGGALLLAGGATFLILEYGQGEATTTNLKITIP